ncbi:hypothetical protein UT300012_22850 [Paraclostridium bifermentans]
MGYLVMRTYQGDLSEQVQGIIGTVQEVSSESIVDLVKRIEPKSDIELKEVLVNYDPDDEDDINMFGICKPLVCFEDVNEYHLTWYYIVELH